MKNQPADLYKQITINENLYNFNNKNKVKQIRDTYDNKYLTTQDYK